MRCVSVCTSYGHNFVALNNYLHDHSNTTAYRQQVIHRKEGESDIFYFAHGPIIFWNISQGEEKKYLKEIEEFSQQTLNQKFIDVDEFSFEYGQLFAIHDDLITLPEEEAGNILVLLALSFALAQSTKLSIFESTVQRRLESSRDIPLKMARHGTIHLSKRALRKLIGEIFLEKSEINLHYALLETPEFFWNYSELEPFYRPLAKYLEIASRVEILNKKLDTLQDLFHMMNSEIDNQHGNRLEWLIIWLILFEVILSIIKDIFKLL